MHCTYTLFISHSQVCDLIFVFILHVLADAKLQKSLSIHMLLAVLYRVDGIVNNLTSCFTYRKIYS